MVGGYKLSEKSAGQPSIPKIGGNTNLIVVGIYHAVVGDYPLWNNH